MNAIITDITTARRRRDLNVLLDRCRNGLDQPLTEDTRDRIVELVADPSEQTWDAAHGVFVDGRTTLWQALLAHTRYRHGAAPQDRVTDAGFEPFRPPQIARVRGWEKVPTPTQVLAAIGAQLDAADTHPHENLN